MDLRVKVVVQEHLSGCVISEGRDRIGSFILHPTPCPTPHLSSYRYSIYMNSRNDFTRASRQVTHFPKGNKRASWKQCPNDSGTRDFATCLLKAWPWTPNFLSLSFLSHMKTLPTWYRHMITVKIHRSFVHPCSKYCRPPGPGLDQIWNKNISLNKHGLNFVLFCIVFLYSLISFTLSTWSHSSVFKASL